MNPIAAHPENRGKFYLQTILSYFLILALCCFYLLGFSPEKAFCYIYYIDHQIGADVNDGLARTCSGINHGPWKTLKNINEYPDRFGPGDKILLKRGLTWKLSDETLNRVYTVSGANTALAIRCGGSSTNGVVNYITFGDYGPMHLTKPTIVGDNITPSQNDSVIIINNDFIRIRNINITFNKQGYWQKNDDGTYKIPYTKTGLINGKGISIFKSTNSDVPHTPDNILIESCDISNCPENGITISPGREYVAIDGYSNLPTLSATSPVISFLLIISDPPEQTGLASTGLTASTTNSSTLTAAAALPPPPPPTGRHIPRPRHSYRPFLPPPQLPDATELERLLTEASVLPSPAELIPPPFLDTPIRPPVIPTIPSPYPPELLPTPTEIALAVQENLTSTSLTPAELLTIPPPEIPSSVSGSAATMDESGDSGSANIGYYSSIYRNGQSGVSIFYDPTSPTPKAKHITINNCAIYENNNHGIYYEGDNAFIENNKIYSNGRPPSTLRNRPPNKDVNDHNIYLKGDNTTVSNNDLLTAINGDGFRYKGSNLMLDRNTIDSNFRHGVGFWIDENDANNYTKNYISNNTISSIAHTTYTSADGDFVDMYNKGIAISRNDSSSCGFFQDTTIYKNTIDGIWDGTDYPRGIYLQGCSGKPDGNNSVTIDHNAFNYISGKFQIEVNADNGSDFDYKFYTDNNTYNNDNDNSHPVGFCYEHNATFYGNFCLWKNFGQSMGWRAYEQNSTNYTGPPCQ